MERWPALVGSREAELRLGSVSPLSAAERVALFHKSKPVLVAFGAAGISSGALSILASPSSWLLASFVSMFFGILLFTRLWLERFNDQERALDVFGRVWAIVLFTASVSFGLLNHFWQLCVDVPDRGVIAIAMQGIGAAMYLHLSGVRDIYRISANLSVVLVRIAPRYSAMPHDQCTLLHWAGILLGEVLGLHMARMITTWQGVRLSSSAPAAERVDPARVHVSDRTESGSVASEKVGQEEPPTTDEMVRRLAGSNEDVAEILKFDVLTLCFTDKQTEMVYVAMTFERMHHVHELACFAGLAISAFDAYLNTDNLWLVNAMSFTFFALLLRARWRVMNWRDVPLAHLVFCDAWAKAVRLVVLAGLGAFVLHAEWVAVMDAGDCLASANSEDRLLGLSSWTCRDEAAPLRDDLRSNASRALLLVLIGSHHRVVALPPHVRMDNRLAVCIAVLFGNICSKIGPEGRWLSPETLPNFGVALCVLVLGELMGYSIDYAGRSLFRDIILASAAAAVIEVKTKARLAAVEASAQELERANASNIAQLAADKRLNHVIKGRCGSAISAIDLYIRLAKPHHKRTMPSELEELLSQSTGHLQEAIEWCHRRQVFVQLEEKSYVSRPTPSHLEELLRGYLSPTDSLSCNVRGEVWVDVTVLRISLDEIISNALKYRRKNSKLRMDAALVPPVLRVRIINVNSPGGILLSPAECQQLMSPGYKSHTCSAMSDGLGLDSVTTALAAASGAVTLSQDRQHTTVEFTLPAYIRTDEAGGEGSPSARTSTPPSPVLRSGASTASVCASLDADAQMVVQGHHLPYPHRSPPHSAPDTAASATGGGPGAAGEEKGLRLMGIASGHEARGFLSDILASLSLSAVQSIVLPGTPAGCDDLCAAVAGHPSEDSDAGAGQRSPQPPVDAIFISMPVGGEEQSVDGTSASAQLARRLREQGFEGVVCVVPPFQPANAHGADALPPGVDGVVNWQSARASVLERAVSEAQAVLHHRHRGACDGPVGDRGLRTRSACCTATTSVGEASVTGTVRVSADLAAPMPLVAAPRCVALDDEKIPRQIQRLFMRHHLEADMAVSGALGETDEEVNHFIDVAMGERDLELRPTSGACTPADIVILDENISPPTILGSKMAVELRARGYAGVIVVLTGASSTHVARIASLDAVDLAFYKGSGLPHMAALVKEAMRHNTKGNLDDSSSSA